MLRKANHIEKCSSDSLTDIVHLAVGISRAPFVIDLIGPRNTKKDEVTIKILGFDVEEFAS